MFGRVLLLILGAQPRYNKTKAQLKFTLLLQFLSLVFGLHNSYLTVRYFNRKWRNFPTDTFNKMWRRLPFALGV